MKKQNLILLFLVLMMSLLILCACTQNKQGPKGDSGRGIVSIDKTSTDGNVDTYTILYTDGSTSTFTVTNAIDTLCRHNFVNYICSYCGEEYFTPGLIIKSNPKLDGSYYVSGYDGIDREVYIPSHYKNGIVDRIGENAFNGHSGIKNVFISHTVKNIGDSAFKNSSQLVNVYIPKDNSLEMIGNNAFNGCRELLSINYLNNVTKLGDNAFSNCTKIQTFESLSNLTNIGARTFENCDGLLSINLTNVLEIGQYAFNNCISITSLIIPECLENLGEKAFNNCKSLKVLNWNAINCKDITLSISIDCTFFKGCNISTINVGENVSYLPFSVFNGCTDLEIVRYLGAKDDWNRIEKGNDWNKNTGTYKVYCKDGVIEK